LGKNAISRLEYLIELKKLKNLMDLIIEDNPVLSQKEAPELLKGLPVRNKPRLLSESIDIKTNYISEQINIIPLPKEEKDVLNLPEITEPTASNGNKSVRNSSNNSFKGSNKSSSLNIPKVHTSASQICNTVSSFYPTTNSSRALQDDLATEINESERIKSDIIKEWLVEKKSDGDNKKSSKVISGLAEIESQNKLLIYGNALDILDNEAYYETINFLHFEYVNITQICVNEILDKIKRFKNLLGIKFSNNNIKSLSQLTKLKNLSDKLEKLNIENNNEIGKLDMLKDFLIYLFPKIRFINDEEITDIDIIRASKHTKFLDKCTEQGLENRLTAEINNGISKVDSNEKIELKTDKQFIIDFNFNELKDKYFNFVKENLHSVLEDLINEK
jgi:hypothetical protein